MTSRGTKSFFALNREVIDHGLCSGCGTCVGVCLAGAIDFNDNRSYPEVVDEQKCQACGMCVRVCPGKGVSLNAIAAESKTPAQKFNVDVGNYIRFLIGHSIDEHIRSKSSSGALRRLCCYMRWKIELWIK